MTIYYITIFFTAITSLLAFYTGRADFDKRGVKKTGFHSNLLFVILTAAILIFVAGLRWKVGTDYSAYAKNYHSYIANVWFDIMSFNEPGIKIIAKISSFVYNDYATMIFLASVITIGLSVATISRYSDMFGFSILLFILSGCWHGSFNGIRQYLAAAILFAGYRYIIERKSIKYLLVVIIAGAFHASAFVMVIMYFVAMREINIKQVIIIAVGVVVLYFSYGTIFGFIETYKNTSIRNERYMTTTVNFFRVAVTFAPVVLYFFFTPKRKLSSKDTFYVNSLIINAALMLATMGSAYLARIVIYTNFYAILAFPRILNFQNQTTKQTFKYLIVIFYCIYWYIEVSGSYSLNNFRWIFNRP